MVWRTRSKTAVYLLATVEEGVHSAKLPAIRQALGFFMHLHSFCGLKDLPMRELQMWSQNSSWITFDLLFGRKWPTTGNIPAFVSFRPFFGTKDSNVIGF